MQTAILVHCTTGMRRSLREAIASDPKLAKYDLHLDRQFKPGRNPGWTKLTSSDGGPGAINLEWDGDTRTLTARVVSRSRQGPFLTIGLFIRYLLARHGKRIRTITVLP